MWSTQMEIDFRSTWLTYISRPIKEIIRILKRARIKFYFVFLASVYLMWPTIVCKFLKFSIEKCSFAPYIFPSRTSFFLVKYFDTSLKFNWYYQIFLQYCIQITIFGQYSHLWSSFWAYGTGSFLVVFP